MSVKKLIAITFIYMCAFVAWMVLGVSNETRTNKSFQKLESEVVSLYGDALIITAPECYSKVLKFKEELINGKKEKVEYYEKSDYELLKSDIKININLDQRKKGNLWFPTFKAVYNAEYEFNVEKGQENKDSKYYIYTTLGSSNSIYNNIQLSINDEKMQSAIPLIRKKEMEIAPFEKDVVKFSISYECSGMENLSYFISRNVEDISQINDFSLTMITDFKNYDFPQNTMSPVEKKELENGYELIWRYNKSVTGKDIGIVIPNKLNPGTIVSRVTFFAPVSLLFFFIVLFIFSVLLGIDLHPMNYFFLAATFFSFHLMYSYFSDHLNIYLTFVIASAVSLFLTVTYLRIFTPKKLAYLYAPLIQIIYLIVFSYSFFFKGITGVIVTICSVITLFILMQTTAKINWENVFNKK